METISLKSITFNSFENHAKLVGEVTKESLSYLTTIILDVLDLNKIINLLQKNNEEMDVNELIKSSDFSDFTEYEINLNELSNNDIYKDELDFLVHNQLQKQIRA